MAPDKFAGTLSAGEAADAIATGWLSARPADVIVRTPLSDGGPGFLAVLEAALPEVRRVTGAVRDPLGRPVPASVLLAGDTAYVESAQAVGLHLLAPAERDPEQASSAGLADLLELALQTGAQTLVIGLGGSATCDGGRAFLEALQVTPEHPESGQSVALHAKQLVAAVDVFNPLLGANGAAAVFAPQKGAAPDAVVRIEDRVHEWARALPGLGAVADQPGAGAAGGLGAALLWLGARCEPGVERVAAAAGLAAAMAEADLVVTGEGAYDATSLRGKVAGAVAALAGEAALPCFVLAGQVLVGRREAAAHGIADTMALADLAGTVSAALAEPRRWLIAAAARLARRWTQM